MSEAVCKSERTVGSVMACISSGDRSRELRNIPKESVRIPGNRSHDKIRAMLPERFQRSVGAEEIRCVADFVSGALKTRDTDSNRGAEQTLRPEPRAGWRGPGN